MQHYEHKRKANDPKFHKALTFFPSYSAAVENMAYKRFHKIYRPCQAVWKENNLPACRNLVLVIS